MAIRRHELSGPEAGAGLGSNGLLLLSVHCGMFSEIVCRNTTVTFM
jgi:hypothetical protein